MKRFEIKIVPGVLTDIQEITDWYNEQQPGSGRRFQNTVIRQINSLVQAPQIYAIRYKEIRCMLVKKFPYMVHFYVNRKNNTVEILAVISNYRNPEIWEERTGREQ
jgi:plasmid stabilization system protein ParE